MNKKSFLHKYIISENIRPSLNGSITILAARTLTSDQLATSARRYHRRLPQDPHENSRGGRDMDGM